MATRKCQEVNITSRNVGIILLLCLMMQAKSLMATSGYESYDRSIKKEEKLIDSRSRFSSDHDHRQQDANLSKQSNLDNTDEKRFYVMTNASRGEDEDDNTAQREVHVLQGQRSNNSSSTETQRSGQDAEHDEQGGRKEGEKIGQEVEREGGEGGGVREEEREGGGGMGEEIGQNSVSREMEKERERSGQNVDSKEGKESGKSEPEPDSTGSKGEGKKREKNGGQKTDSEGRKKKREKGKQGAGRSEGGKKERVKSRQKAESEGGGNAREKSGRETEDSEEGERARQEQKNWTEWFVEGKRVDVTVAPVVSWPTQPSANTQPGQQRTGNVTLELRGEGGGLIIDLHPTRDLLAATYRDPVIDSAKHSGGLAVCEYQGEVRGLAGSWVALSLCPVIRGMVVGGAGAVWVEPGRGSRAVGDPHRVFTPDLRHGANKSCGVRGKETHSNSLQNTAHNRTRRSVLHGDTAWMTKTTRFVEMVLVADSSYYEAFGDETSHRCKAIVNVANAVYRQLGVVVVLTHLEIWKSSDEIVVSPVSDDTLDNLKPYRKKFIAEHPHIPSDNMQLLTVVDFDGNTIGKATINGICKYDESVGVVQDHKGGSVGGTGRTLAHELGHNLGLQHDENDTNCECPGNQCIMKETGGSHSEVLWSTCSKRNLTRNLESFMFDCLRNEPTRLEGSCGDGVLGEGEECDCGPALFCKNPCCIPKTCKLAANATCATGPCCDVETCKPKVASAMCREARSECDVPEYCVGNSELCPPDRSAADGAYCDGGQGHCYGGWCGSREQRCRSVWGEDGKVGHQNGCYKYLNTQGSTTGNCGRSSYDPKKYLPCDNEDVLCGTLHCETDGTVNHPGVAYTMWEWQGIWGTELEGKCHTVMASSDISPAHWLVPNGSPCGSGKWCVEQRCVSVPVSGWLIGFWIFVAVSIILVFLLWDHIRWWWESRGRTCLSPHFPPCAACLDACCCPCMNKINRLLISVLPSVGPVCKKRKPKQHPKPEGVEANGVVSVHHQNVGVDTSSDPWGNNSWPKDEVVIQVPNKTHQTNLTHSHHPPPNGTMLPYSTPLLNHLNSCDSWPIADRNSSDRLSQRSESHSEKGLLEPSKQMENTKNGEPYFPSDSPPTIQPVRRAPSPPRKVVREAEERGQRDGAEDGGEMGVNVHAVEVDMGGREVTRGQYPSNPQRPVIPSKPELLSSRSEVPARSENDPARSEGSTPRSENDPERSEGSTPRPELPARPVNYPARPEIPPRPEVVLPLRPDVVLPNRQKPDVPARPY